MNTCLGCGHESLDDLCQQCRDEVEADMDRDECERNNAVHELAELRQILLPVLDHIPLACCCNNGECPRCRLEKIIRPAGVPQNVESVESCPW